MSGKFKKEKRESIRGMEREVVPDGRGLEAWEKNWREFSEYHLRTNKKKHKKARGKFGRPHANRTTAKKVQRTERALFCIQWLGSCHGRVGESPRKSCISSIRQKKGKRCFDEKGERRVKWKESTKPQFRNSMKPHSLTRQNERLTGTQANK